MKTEICVAGELLVVHADERPDFANEVHIYISKAGVDADWITRAEALAAARALVAMLEQADGQ